MSSSVSPSDSRNLFACRFEALTNCKPFPWQVDLFAAMAAGNFEKLAHVALPTGTGKTSIMPIWLLALAQAAEESSSTALKIPRRLVWVVNRRVVVDQATREAEGLSERLETKPELESVRCALRRICATSTGDLLAVSTLRGQFADNAEWRNDPSRPAVVVGTVDMIGSRLLFAGYGSGFKYRPLHAGFLGQDALLVHDEAHLEPAFQELITSIEAEQKRCREIRALRLMALTATSRAGDKETFGLGQADREHEFLRQRLEAKKGISFRSVNDEGDIKDAIFRCALEFKETGLPILIFLRKLEDVAYVADKLTKANLPVQALTGTMRGLERDDLVANNKIFARFLRTPKVGQGTGTVYLVCTSAGEVGIDISAHHLICDLAPLDSMAQRFGRVNRYGEADEQISALGEHIAAEGARLEVVYLMATTGSAEKKTNLQLNQANERTLELLRKLPRRSDGRLNASPAALEELMRNLPAAERDAAFTPLPNIRPANDILFDAWALTSVRGKLPGRPPVADWLHGVAEWEPPETYLAWREEVECLAGEVLDDCRPDDLLEDYPLKPHELLRDRTSRVFRQLKQLQINLKKNAAQEIAPPVWILEEGDVVRVTTLDAVVDAGEEELYNRTILLPPSAGALGIKNGASTGMLDGNSVFEAAHRNLYDVSGDWWDEKKNVRRCRIWDDQVRPPGMRLIRTIDLIANVSGGNDSSEETATPNRLRWYWYVGPATADDDGSWTATTQQVLEPHCRTAESFAAALVSKLANEAEVVQAITFAAKRHDLGKDRELWQRSIGNAAYPGLVLAKSDRRVRLDAAAGYRHELGSLIDIAKDSQFIQLAPEVQDLILHLIAAHHGRGRPHFPADEIFDPENPMEAVAEIAQEVPRRFARLQRKYGRWGLAYLESLVRAADALASRCGSTNTNEISLQTGDAAAPPKDEAAR